MQDTVKTILNFWFDQTDPRQWDLADNTFDFELRERFKLTYILAEQGLCDDWLNTPNGALAYSLLMGAFPQRIYSDQNKADTYNDLAVQASKKAIKKGFDQLFQPNKRKFLYLPLMNSPYSSDVELAVRLFKNIAQQEPVYYRRAQKRLNEIQGFASSESIYAPQSVECDRVSAKQAALV
tara:strand:+ start:290392 stop:290931 length:540 start_codon:yes stop_codon:yes gene_type:complete